MNKAIIVFGTRYGAIASTLPHSDKAKPSTISGTIVLARRISKKSGSPLSSTCSIMSPTSSACENLPFSLTTMVSTSESHRFSFYKS